MTDDRRLKTEDRKPRKEGVKLLSIHGSRSTIHCSLFSVLCLLSLCSCGYPVHKDTFVISGTFLEVISSSPQAAKIVYQEFYRLDKIFNFYDSQSEISRLNRTYNTPFKASEELIAVLKLSQEINRVTGGCFDVTYANLYSFWKELIKNGDLKSLPSSREIEDLRKLCGNENIDIDFNEKTALIKKQGVKIDLSGIAKGYMVDKAGEKLKQEGIDSAVINAGGDIYCLGTNRGKSWKVGVKNPLAAGIIEKEELVNQAAATSGNYERFFDFNGRRYSHLIDPRNGIPVENNILSVSVVSEKCAIADSLATAFFVMGLEEIEKFVKRNNYPQKVFVVVKQGDKERTCIFEGGKNE